jgi:UDP-glucuronate 4-epimerase
MKALVTGSAGFIGSFVTQRLLARGESVIGIDNHNDYYDPSLKEARLSQFVKHPNYVHVRMDLADERSMQQLFNDYQPKKVVHLAAQAGVRYSIDHPMKYIHSNLLGFANVLEGCRSHGVEHLVYASSSSVYGANTAMPYSAHHHVDHPLSLYAATKKSNELMAHSYSHLYKIPTTGLRFFTVYGPWGRPDMAPMHFAKSILSGKPIQVFNHGKHRRDFTYIDDIVEGVLRVLDHPAQPDENWRSDQPDPASSSAPWRIYNIGNQQPVELLEFISALEDALGVKAVMEMKPLQPGDVPDTYADVSDLDEQFNHRPSTPIREGVQRFAQWYRSHHRS